MLSEDGLQTQFEKLADLENDAKNAFEQQDWELFSDLFKQRLALITQLAEFISTELPQGRARWIALLNEQKSRLDVDIEPVAELLIKTKDELKAFHQKSKASSAYGSTKRLRT